MAEDDKQPEAPAVTSGQPEVMHYAVPAPVLKAAIELIDEQINGKMGRGIVNALERSPLIKPPEG